MYSYLIITALTVSIDSFVCGFSLSLISGRKAPVILGITLTVFIMCLFTNYMTLFFDDYITENTASLGGLLLIGVGTYNLIKLKKQDKSDISYKKGALRQSLITGFAVGLDGALANLSLSIMGMNEFYVPLTIALMHGLMITFGVILARTIFYKIFAKIQFFPPVILILLGGYKLLGLFI